MAILALKSTDSRMSIEQMLTAKCMIQFMKGLKPENVFVAFTHCDLQKPSEKWIKEKIQSFKKLGLDDIPDENMIYFEKDVKSLKNFVDKFVKGDIEFEENLPEKVKNVDKDLEKACKELDQLHKLNL